MINNGTYGTVRPSLITSNDVDIYYYYKPSRSTDSLEFTAFQQLPSDLITNTTTEDGSTLQGVYNLQLPLDYFGNAGIYTVYIKPRELTTVIYDVSTLTGYSNIRGIILNINDIQNVGDSTIFNNGGLVGYRIEYFDDSSFTTPNGIFRIITSNNRCEPLSQNNNTSASDGVSYSFNNSSNLMFCTVTPSAAMSFNTNDKPYIGTKSPQTYIKLVNTKFDPVCIEIEMTDHDIEDIATMIEGDQIRNLNKGMLTTFTKDGTVYSQADLMTIVNKQKDLHDDVKLYRDKSNYDKTEETDLANIKENYQ